MVKYMLNTVVVLTIATLVIAMSEGGATTKPVEKAAKAVRTETVTAVDEARDVKYAGVLRAAKRAELAFTLSGRLERRPVDIGDGIKQGQVLAELDAKPYRHSLEAAEAALTELKTQLAQAERDTERLTKLTASKAATTEELEQIQARRDSLKASQQSLITQVNEAKRQLEETQLRAPFDGLITEVMLEPGEFASPSQAVVAMSGAKQLELEIELQESILPYIREGETVRIQLPFFDQRILRGEIYSVGRATMGRGRLFPVIVRLDQEEGVLPGMTADVYLSLREEGVLTLPITAVINPGGVRPAVFVLRGEKVERLEVEVSRLLGERAAIRGALQAGDEVVVAGFAGLMDGDVVEVRQ